MSSAAVLNSAKTLFKGPSKLKQLLQNLNRQPKLELQNVTKLQIQWNAKGNNPEARYFVKDALTRIRWANPSLEIEADKLWQGRAEQMIQLTFASGKKHTIEMDGKPSTGIVQELMEVAGGEPWQEYKKQRQQGGHPLLPGVSKHLTSAKPRTS